jgi:hypothetical protein
MKRSPGHIRGRLLAAGIALLAAAPVNGQYAERPYGVNSTEEEADASGRSVKNPRVRAIHTTDPNLQGGTAYLLNRDPFLAYQLGRNLNFREFRSRDGVFSELHHNAFGFVVGGVAFTGGPMKDTQAHKITANNQTSCSGCHNLPYGNAGGGVTFSKDSGFGRNTPHYYGAGLMEMLTIQIRAEIMQIVDTNADGWIDLKESQLAPDPILIQATPGGPMIDFGSAKLDGNLEPQLNQMLKVWYGCEGYMPGAQFFGDQGTDKYNFELVTFGWGQLVPENALNPTCRTFLWDPYVAHSGLESYDPSTLIDPDLDGVSAPTLAGAIQFPATHLPPDRGFVTDPLGFSIDDPDEDGYLTEISEGDLDLAEWFMLNAPRPAFAGSAAQYNAGVALMDQFSCTSCHVADWEIKAADGTHPGDRRFFDLDVTWDRTDARLEGSLVPLYTLQGQDYVRNFGSFDVEGIFTDFLHHDMGDGFAEVEFDGWVNRWWRTAPLWGVGTGFPWGHDGQSLTLRDAVLRHDGEGLASRQLFEAANAVDQDALIDFLERLVLYDVESLPSDIDGNGRLDTNHVINGVDTGPERFNAEWLFKRPVKIQGLVTPSHANEEIRSFAPQNLTLSYGLDLQYRIDSDLDGWPDVWDNAPLTPGYRDGVND